jgi:hypothetical protein
MHRRKAILMASIMAGLGAFGAGSAGAQEDGPIAFGDIALEPSASGMMVVGRVIGVRRGAVNATMTIERSGQSGNVSTSQSGTFELAAGETADVARTGFSYSPGDRIAISLSVDVEGRIVSESAFKAGD